MTSPHKEAICGPLGNSFIWLEAIQWFSSSILGILSILEALYQEPILPYIYRWHWQNNRIQLIHHLRKNTQSEKYLFIYCGKWQNQIYKNKKLEEGHYNWYHRNINNHNVFAKGTTIVYQKYHSLEEKRQTWNIGTHQDGIREVKTSQLLNKDYY